MPVSERPRAEVTRGAWYPVGRKRDATAAMRHWLHDDDSESQEAKRESNPRRGSTRSAANASSCDPECSARGSDSESKTARNGLANASSHHSANPQKCQVAPAANSACIKNTARHNGLRFRSGPVG